MTSNQNDPQRDEHLLEQQEGLGVYPGGLIQTGVDEECPIGTSAYILGYTDELGPQETLWVGPYKKDDLQDVNSKTVTPEGEIVFVLDIFLEAGTARRHYCRSHHINNNKLKKKSVKKLTSISTEEDRDDRGARAKADFILLARSNGLGKAVNLDYFDQTDNSHRYPVYCKLRLENYLRRIRKRIGPFPWLEVLEYGEENLRLHHHLLVPNHVSEKMLSELWKYGGVVFRRSQTLDGIGKMANYLTKTFEQPEDMRPRERRYKVGRSVMRERPIRLIGTKETVEETLQKMVGDTTKIREWHSKHAFSAGGFSWDRSI